MSGGYYCLLVDDIGAIDADTGAFAFKCVRYFSAEFRTYRPLPFVDYTGYTELVRDEIEYVIACQTQAGRARLGAEAFSKAWGFESQLDLRVVELSGGWRKFLGVCLFTNYAAEAYLYIDVASHLADQRLALLNAYLSNNATGPVVFCEYDTALIRKFAPQTQLLYDCGDRLELIDTFPCAGGGHRACNYEPDTRE
jgi:hypothetical protein